MTANHLQEKMQSAYKTGNTTESALLRIQNDILHDLDKTRGVILVLLDLSAACDTIGHDLYYKGLKKALLSQVLYCSGFPHTSKAELV